MVRINSVSGYPAGIVLGIGLQIRRRSVPNYKSGTARDEIKKAVEAYAIDVKSDNFPNEGAVLKIQSFALRDLQSRNLLPVRFVIRNFNPPLFN